MKQVYLICLLLLSGGLYAQVSNDECAGATVLPAVVNYCSGESAFTSAGATASFDFDEYDGCMLETNQIKDVWFSFVATRNSASIEVNGAVAGNSRGSLQQPQFTIYGGECDDLTELACRTPFDNGRTIANSGSLVYNEFRRGETYYILVSGRNGNEGSFELCVDQFDAVPSPSSDCGTGVILCDKSPFAINELQGRGMVNDDLLSDNIQCGIPPPEQNSAWYKWTCDQPGTLTFDITPLGASPDEDIDFVIYELTDGLDGCSARVPVRQMFSGDNQGDVAGSMPCRGSTGLEEGDSDITEDCGCQTGNDSYLAPLVMEAGKSYALVVLNFSGSGDGFSIEFGGTGTFLGPEPNLLYSTTETCVGESVTFQDQSTSVDGIAEWNWDFGPTATPRTAQGAGPHEVRFAQSGNPNVTLAITSTRNCIEYLSLSEVEVVCCEDQFAVNPEVSAVTCPDRQDGSIALNATTSVTGAELTYVWSNGADTPTADDLSRGTYGVTFTDGSGCEFVDSFTVGGPEPFVFDTLIVEPDCAGGTNGAMEFSILSGGAGGYEYSMNGSPFTGRGRLDNLPVSTVTVEARDANGCSVTHDIFVDERQLGLIAGSTGFIEPTCNGGDDGALSIEIANGVPGILYNYGRGFGPQPRQAGIGAGTYQIAARDAEGCTGNFEIVVTEPPPLEMSLRADSSSCFGAADGSIFATAIGGRPGYNFGWSDGGTGSDRVNLDAGTYAVNLTDSVGCSVVDTVRLVDPDEIIASVVDLLDIPCFGDPSGAVTLGATGGSPDYTYSSDGLRFRTEPRLDSLVAGPHRLYVRDARGCVDSVDATLTEPMEFVIDVDTDIQLSLGYDTTLLARANYGPLTYTWGPDSVQCLSADCSRVRILPLRTGDYFVAGTNAAGCVDTAYIAFLVFDDLPTYIPNVISPDGDGNNDRFTIFGSPAIANVEVLRIYNRWGGLVFESSAPYPANEELLGWDGTLAGEPVNAGVYVYYTEISYINGRREGYRGDITVVR